VRRGENVEMAVENALDVPTTVHWHGLLGPGETDGGPHQTIDHGRTWRPMLNIDQPAATLWYHPHPHHDTARQIHLAPNGLLPRETAAWVYGETGEVEFTGVNGNWWIGLSALHTLFAREHNLAATA